MLAAPTKGLSQRASHPLREVRRLLEERHDVTCGVAECLLTAAQLPESKLEEPLPRKTM
jgi:hypothetical protein